MRPLIILRFAVGIVAVRRAPAVDVVADILVRIVIRTFATSGSPGRVIVLVSAADRSESQMVSAKS
ncbi:MAG: hypothetical protein WD627_00585 [Actinomycetota bacterium]